MSRDGVLFGSSSVLDTESENNLFYAGDEKAHAIILNITNLIRTNKMHIYI